MKNETEELDDMLTELDPPYESIEELKIGRFLDQYGIRGRVDAKVHRKTGVLELKSMSIESNELSTSEGLDRLVSGIKEFAGFHRCEQVELGKITPNAIKSKLTEAFKS